MNAQGSAPARKERGSTRSLAARNTEVPFTARGGSELRDREIPGVYLTERKLREDGEKGRRVF